MSGASVRPEPPPWVLAVNGGSSTLKAAVVDPGSGQRRLTAYAEAEAGRLQMRRGDEVEERSLDGRDQAGLVTALVAALHDDERSDLVAVAHRLVHGGALVREHAVVDGEVRAALAQAAELAPLHVPAALRALDAARTALPDLPHVVALDTAFHRDLPEVAFRYAVPERWYADLGVRRYGFHGLSHQSVSEQAAARLGRPLDSLRLVTVHLGNGCSAAAVHAGRSVDTTMGFTPLEGLVMGTRSGDIDPGVLGFVAERTGTGLDELLRTLNHESGLLGLSGLSHDVRVLTEAEAGGSAAAGLALDVYCYRAAQAVAAMAVPLGGLDALVFTGGVGEHSARVRAGVVGWLGQLALVIDEERNAAHGEGTGGRVSPPGDGSPSVWVVPTDEELVMARVAAALVG